jgi:2-methylisocitrate lyase-like PEP mutase family enzyme
MTDDRRKRLRSALTSGWMISAPGVYDMVSALLADRLGFDAIYMTGYGVVASSLGLPDAGLATYSDMIARVAMIAGRTTTPLIADADTGYGGLLNVAHTVRGYEQAGAAGLQLEDQEFPKKCGHTPDRRCIPVDDMVMKIRVAIDARKDPDLLIVARTDARTEYGLDEAIRRAQAYAAAGADMLFVEALESSAEMMEVCNRVDRPLMANMVEGGKTPIMSAADLSKAGFAIAIFPVAALLAATSAMDQVYRYIKQSGSTVGMPTSLFPFPDMSRLMGFPAVWDFERRYAQNGKTTAR